MFCFLFLFLFLPSLNFLFLLVDNRLTVAAAACLMATSSSHWSPSIPPWKFWNKIFKFFVLSVLRIHVEVVTIRDRLMDAYMLISMCQSETRQTIWTQKGHSCSLSDLYHFKYYIFGKYQFKFLLSNLSDNFRQESGYDSWPLKQYPCNNYPLVNMREVTMYLNK